MIAQESGSEHDKAEARQTVQARQEHNASGNCHDQFNEPKHATIAEKHFEHERVHVHFQRHSNRQVNEHEHETGYRRANVVDVVCRAKVRVVDASARRPAHNGHHQTANEHHTGKHHHGLARVDCQVLFGRVCLGLIHVVRAAHQQDGRVFYAKYLLAETTTKQTALTTRGENKLFSSIDQRNHNAQYCRANQTNGTIFVLHIVCVCVCLLRFVIYLFFL